MITANRAAFRAMLDPESYGTTLLVAATQLIGVKNLLTTKPVEQEAFDVTPIDTYKELAKVLGAENISGLMFNRLMAAVAVVTTDLFYTSTYDFIMTCNLLAGSDLDLSTFDPADPWEMATAMMEVNILDSDPEDRPPFSDEVRKYMGVTLTEFGFAAPPKGLTMAIMPKDFNPAYEYAEDDAALGAILDHQTENAVSIDQLVTENRAELMTQLQELGISDLAELTG